MKKLKDYYLKTKKSGNLHMMNQEIADTEARLLFMTYSFTSFVYLSYIEDTGKRRSFLTNLWGKIILLLK